MDEPIRIELPDGGALVVRWSPPAGERVLVISRTDEYGRRYTEATQTVDDATARRLIEALGGVPVDELEHVGYAHPQPPDGKGWQVHGAMSLHMSDVPVYVRRERT